MCGKKTSLIVWVFFESIPRLFKDSFESILKGGAVVLIPKKVGQVVPKNTKQQGIPNISHCCILFFHWESVCVWLGGQGVARFEVEI